MSSNESGDIGFSSLMRERLPLLFLAPTVASILGYGLSFAIPPTYTARAVIIPPQQQQSATSLALQNLGALAGAAGAATGIKSPIDQYVALLQSANTSNRLIEQFKLMEVYDEELQVDTLRELQENSRISAGRKDGLITIEVEDREPERAAAIANAYVEQLRRLSSELVLTEAQQRRAFFERQMQQAKTGLATAQTALQESGIGEGAIRAEPRAFADRYARLRAEATSAEVRLQGMRHSMTDGAVEVQQIRNQLATLHSELAKAESENTGASQGEYINRYRNFKYQEALLELFVRQFEIAKIDESRDGPIVQVVDAASKPERKTKPRRGLLAIGAGTLTLAAMLAWFALRASGKYAARRPDTSKHPAPL